MGKNLIIGAATLLILTCLSVVAGAVTISYSVPDNLPGNINLTKGPYSGYYQHGIFDINSLLASYPDASITSAYLEYSFKDDADYVLESQMDESINYMGESLELRAVNNLGNGLSEYFYYVNHNFDHLITKNYYDEQDIAYIYIDSQPISSSSTPYGPVERDGGAPQFWDVGLPENTTEVDALGNIWHYQHREVHTRNFIDYLYGYGGWEGYGIDSTWTASVDLPDSVLETLSQNGVLDYWLYSAYFESGQFVSSTDFVFKDATLFLELDTTAIVPEPVSSVLFVSGGTLFALRRYRKSVSYNLRVIRNRRPYLL